MDILSEKLQILHIEDINFELIETTHPLNYQKCYISQDLFKKHFQTPGQTISIKISNDFAVCRLYPKKLLPNSILEINFSVMSSLRVDKHCFVNICDINIFKDVPVFSEISVRVIFDNINIIKMYSDKELINIIRQNLLKMLVFRNNCIVNFSTLPRTQRMGILYLEVSSTTPMGVGKISSRTKVDVVEKLTQFQFEQLNKDVGEIYAMERPFERLMQIIKVNELYSKMDTDKVFPPSKQVLLVGSSGCGKSTLVRHVAKKAKCSIVNVVGHEINKTDPGETESMIREKFKMAFDYAKLSGKCIIHLEAVDNLCPHVRGSATHVQRAVSQLLNCLDEAQSVSGVVVIGTTSRPEAMEPAIRRYGRLETEIYIPPPSEKERARIISGLVSLSPMIPAECLEELCKEVACMTPGYVGADLQLLCHSLAWKFQQGMLPENSSDLSFWKEEFRKVISSMSPASIKGALGSITTSPLSFHDLAGIDEIKKVLEMSVVWPIQHADAFQRMGIPRPKGVLLHGPPGCAKTSLVRALVTLGTFSLLSVSAAELYSPYVGDAERLIRQLFHRARQNSPCILFIDEIDALAGSRGDKNQVNSEVQDRIIATLLTQMDGVGHRMLAADFLKDKTSDTDDGVIVIGATNRPDMLDAALLRPGRFDKHIHVPPPNYQARLQIFQCVTRNMPLEGVDFEHLAKNTESYSGADIKNICTEAALMAMTEDGVDVKEIRNEHFVKALVNSRSSIANY